MSDESTGGNTDAATVSKVRLTKRDLHALKWTLEQGAVRFDHLQQLLGRLAAKTAPKGLKSRKSAELAKRNTLRIIARWRELGLIDRIHPFHDKPPFYWIAQRGLFELGAQGRANTPSRYMLDHFSQVNRVRLHLEHNDPDKFKLIKWTSERMLKAEWGKIDEADHDARQRPEHTPDAVISASIYTAQGWRDYTIALEVELSVKPLHRLNKILSWLEHEPNHSAVWYYVNEDTREHLTRAVKGKYRKVALYDITTLQRIPL